MQLFKSFLELRLLPLFLILIPLTHNFWSQNNEEKKILLRLDSLAFHSLEFNKKDVIDRSFDLLKESEKFGPNLFQINAYTIQGIVNKNKGYYVSSLNNYLDALNVAHKIKDDARISALLNNIGTVYTLQENYEKALSYFNQSLEIEKKLNAPLQKSIRYFNIGDVYNNIDSLDLALNFYTNSLLIEKKQNNNEGIIYANLGIAEVYIKSGRIDDAERVLASVSKIADPHLIEPTIIYFRLVGDLAVSKNEIQKSLLKYERAEEIIQKHDLVHLLPEILLKKIYLLESQQNWKEASKEYRKFIELNSRLNSVKIKNQLADLSFQNELEKKELEIKYIAQERDLAKLNEQMELNIRNYEQKIVLFLVISLFLIVGIVIYGFKRMAKLR